MHYAIKWVAGAVIGLGAIGALYRPHGSVATISDTPGSKPQYAKAERCFVSQSGYLALSNGDSYATAVGKLGCPGEEMSRTEIADSVTVMYQWWGGSMGGNMNAMFQDGQLVSKAQFGLR